MAQVPSQLQRQQTSSLPVADETSAYVCPMHPDVTSPIAGNCPRCAMALVRGTPYDMRNYELDLQTVPRVVQAGQDTRLILRIAHPGTGELIKKFEVVHEKRYHLFVLSQDMEFFQHIHPEQQPDGTWEVDIAFPRPGYYQVLSDFLPDNGASQFIARPLVVAGYSGDLMAARAHLQPDTVMTKTVDDITATVSYDPSIFWAEFYGHLSFKLTDSRTGHPITDLQTYLGAFGHAFIMSEDTTDYVHAHPVDPLPADADLAALRGGPNVTFEGLLPTPGLYRAWVQFQRNNRVYTFTYTFTVRDLEQHLK
jgi:hypothetical protein